MELTIHHQKGLEQTINLHPKGVEGGVIRLAEGVALYFWIVC
jgi:hypothetical protein